MGSLLHRCQPVHQTNVYRNWSRKLSVLKYNLMNDFGLWSFMVTLLLFAAFSRCVSSRSCFALCHHCACFTLFFNWRLKSSVIAGRSSICPGLEGRRWRIQDGRVSFHNGMVTHIFLSIHFKSCRVIIKMKIVFIDERKPLKSYI